MEKDISPWSMSSSIDKLSPLLSSWSLCPTLLLPFLSGSKDFGYFWTFLSFVLKIVDTPSGPETSYVGEIPDLRGYFLPILFGCTIVPIVVQRQRCYFRHL